MYEVGDFEFDEGSYKDEDDYCRACGADLVTFDLDWALRGKESQDKTEHHIYIPEEEGFVSISGEAYRVCDKCLELLKSGEEEPTVIRLLHPELQNLLPAFQEVPGDERDQIVRAVKIGVLIDLACETDC